MTSFTWRDGERIIRFGRGAAAEAADLAGSHFTLLTTERARELVPGLEEAADEVRFVPPGRVDDISAELLPQVTHDRLIALGGGRVVDAAKAVGAVTGAFVGAVPTTLSGAEMTGFHRMPRGAPRGAPGSTWVTTAVEVSAASSPPTESTRPS